ncbi:MAG: ABC transporter permease, partial [Spirochaetota bacterium]
DGVTIGIDVVVTAFQGVLLYLHPFIMMGLMAVFAYWVISRKYGSLSLMGWRTGRGMLLFTVVGLFLLYGMGFWQETMETLALVITSAIIALLLGVPMGIYASRSDRFEQMLRPVLDFMQTMPAFVYLIPAILFFQVGNVPGVVATVVFALPPGVRLTNLGIREVPKDVVEASHAFGCTDKQLLYKVQIPLAMPTIMAGINQVIMLSLSMVVIASMVGAAGLGQKVYMGILKAKIGLGFEAGLGIVIIAILLDRITQSFGQTEHRNAGSE